MRATSYLFQMVGGVPLVTAPAEIDATTAGRLRALLYEWHSRGHATVVVDLTGTRSCDPAGLSELARAHKQARAEGGGLWLVIPADGDVLRLFAIAGLDRVIPHFTALEQALAQVKERGLVADSRGCEQCAAVFVPQREHARFCSGDCRAAWNRGHMGDPAVDASALAWSVTAMSEATARLPVVKVWDQARAFAAVGEAVWWITMVDATLVRHHREVYRSVIALQPQAESRLIEQTLTGLRFVRNWIGRGAGLDEIIETVGPGVGSRRITGWTWRDVPEPALVWLPARGQAWERSRYRAYQARLAGHTIGETVRPAVTFLTLTGARAASAAT